MGTMDTNQNENNGPIWIKVSRELLKCLWSLTGPEFKVFMVLAVHVDPDHHCFPGQDTLAEVTHYSLPTIKRAIRGLKRKHFIEVEVVRTSKGRHNYYTLCPLVSFGSDTPMDANQLEFWNRKRG